MLAPFCFSTYSSSSSSSSSSQSRLHPHCVDLRALGVKLVRAFNSTASTTAAAVAEASSVTYMSHSVIASGPTLSSRWTMWHKMQHSPPLLVHGPSSGKRICSPPQHTQTCTRTHAHELHWHQYKVHPPARPGYNPGHFASKPHHCRHPCQLFGQL
jgi:hypothetical protein